MEVWNNRDINDFEPEKVPSCDMISKDALEN